MLFSSLPASNKSDFLQLSIATFFRRTRATLKLAFSNKSRTLRAMNRRHFMQLMPAITVIPTLNAEKAAAIDKPLFEISLAQWSNHKSLFQGKIKNLDWAAHTQEHYGINALEYVNGFFKDKAADAGYLAEMNQRVDDLGMKNLLIMIDGEGALGHSQEKKRLKAIDNHKKWVEAAQTLNCHSIRVNASGPKDPEEARKLVSDGLYQLATFAKDFDINIIVENHGGHSSNGTWLAQVLSDVNLPHCGSLPDFGNFGDYDRYQGMKDLIPFAKGVSAKSKEFDDDGNCVETDFHRMMKIVLDSGYRGHVGVEFEGKTLSEDLGIKATIKLLEEVRNELASNYE